jgi:hypothetical protein
MQDNTDSIITIAIALAGVLGGGIWKIFKESRVRPRLALTIKGTGTRPIEALPEMCDMFFHCEVHNLSEKPNAICVRHLVFMNSRKTEILWRSIAVDLYEKDQATNWIGTKLKSPLKLGGMNGKEFVAVARIDSAVASRFLGGSMIRTSPDQEKPFPYFLLLEDTHGNCFTNTLTSKKRYRLLDMTRLLAVSARRIDLENDNTYGRPRLKHLFLFYGSICKLSFSWPLRKVLYGIGLRSSTR